MDRVDPGKEIPPGRALRGRAQGRAGVVPPDEQDLPRVRAENQHQRRTVQNDGEHQHVPEGPEGVRRRRRRRIPNGRPVGEEGHRAGHHHPLRPWSHDVQAPRMEGPLPGPQAVRGMQARLHGGTIEGRRVRHRPSSRFQQGRDAGWPEHRRHAQDPPRKVKPSGPTALDLRRKIHILYARVYVYIYIYKNVYMHTYVLCIYIVFCN